MADQPMTFGGQDNPPQYMGNANFNYTPNAMDQNQGYPPDNHINTGVDQGYANIDSGMNIQSSSRQAPLPQYPPEAVNYQPFQPQPVPQPQITPMQVEPVVTPTVTPIVTPVVTPYNQQVIVQPNLQQPDVIVVKEDKGCCDCSDEEKTCCMNFCKCLGAFCACLLLILASSGSSKRHGTRRSTGGRRPSMVRRTGGGAKKSTGRKGRR